METKTALNSAEKKIPNVNNLVKKTDYNTKITEVENKINNHNHDKYIDTSEFNKLAQANLITKQILMLNCRVSTKKLLQIKQNTCFLKMN